MPVQLLDHSTALSIGGILRYRIQLKSSQISRVKSLQFCVRNTSPVYRNLTPASGPWKIAVALIRGPERIEGESFATGIVPELSPSVGCGQVCRFTAPVEKKETTDNDGGHRNANEWELEVSSEMITQKNWLTVRVEVLAELENAQEEAALEKKQQQQPAPQPPEYDNKDSDALDSEDKEAADIEDVPQVLHPELITCQYKDTAAICGARLPRAWQDRLQSPSSSQAQELGDKGEDSDKSDGLHLVVLTHGIHGSWLDMLYIKEQIDAFAAKKGAKNNRTVTFLSDTNHAGTEEGLQMAGRRVARDILELTGFWPRRPREIGSSSSSTPKRSKSGWHHHKEQHQHKQTNGLFAHFPSATSTSAYSTSTSLDNKNAEKPLLKRETTIRSALAAQPFPRGFRKISFIGHSLGGLINIYALGYIEAVTKGQFFNTLEPVHFTTLASPLLGVSLDHPWVLGFALSKGVIGQTGRDLAMEDRSSKVLSRSSLSSSSTNIDGSTCANTEETNGDDDQVDEDKGTDATLAMSLLEQEEDCELDEGPDPLLFTMARPGSVSHRALKRFRQRICYGNIDNDLPVQYNTCTLMGIPSFDRSQFFSPKGPASGQKKNLYQAAIQSYISILFPKSPPKIKFIEPFAGPSPIVAVHHSEPLPPPSLSPSSPATEKSTADEQQNGDGSGSAVCHSKAAKTTNSSSPGSSSLSSASFLSQSLSLGRKRKQQHQSGRESHQSTVASNSSRTTEELAQRIADGYHTEMDWTKIGVYLQSDAHVQIIVRRKWYNVDGWACVRDIVERLDFS